MSNVRVGEPFLEADSVAADQSPSASYRAKGKRALDLALGLALVPIIAPLVACLCACVWMRDGAWPLFGHRRVGRDDRPFLCWKIRTMVPDAAERLAAHLASDPAAAAEWEADRKLSRDPRVTRFGEFLRRTSLDELPQLWNVLNGEMSFVGPRPVTAEELEKYGAARGAYCRMRPGITGLWQISGRNEVSYGERVQLDLDYLGSISLLRDLKIILRTGLVLVRPTGR
ncbi:MAG: sugar transferase [Pseudomonadota bacterium]